MLIHDPFLFLSLSGMDFTLPFSLYMTLIFVFFRWTHVQIHVAALYRAPGVLWPFLFLFLFSVGIDRISWFGLVKVRYSHALQMEVGVKKC